MPSAARSPVGRVADGNIRCLQIAMAKIYY